MIKTGKYFRETGFFIVPSQFLFFISILVIGWCCFLVYAAGCARSVTQDDDLVQGYGEKYQVAGGIDTIAELSDYQATASHSEVVQLLGNIAGLSDNAYLMDMGTTYEGKNIPVIIFSDPPVSNPQQAAKLTSKGDKLLVLLIGDIHAGEVAGKEALLMLARELATTPDHPLLKNLIIAIAPIYNADGNDRFGLDNRPGQVGPSEGMGERENGQGLDLNRDFIKAEAPETQGLLKFLRDWDPAIFIDTHTTNGSFHQYMITYDGPKIAAGNSDLIEYVRDTMLPEITRDFAERTGYQSFFYGNFNRDKTRWSTYPGSGRYGTPYMGLCNRIGILSEAYSYAPYKDRILGTLGFVKSCMKYISDNTGDVYKTINKADSTTKRAIYRTFSDDNFVAVRSKIAAMDEMVNIKGFVEKQAADGRNKPTDVSKDYEVEHWNRFDADLTVNRPWGYLIPAGEVGIVENLQRHGILVEIIREDIDLDVDIYNIEAVDFSNNVFQGHKLAKVEAGLVSDVSRRITAGTYLVRAGQELGNLVVYLLEPQSEDGLTTWNFLDRYLKVGEEFPIYRLGNAPPPITKSNARPLAEDREFDQIVTSETLRDRRRMPDFNGNATWISSWVDDEHFVQNKDGSARIVEAVTGRSEPMEVLDNKLLADALVKLPSIDNEDTATALANRARSRMTADETAALIEHNRDLYYATFDGSKAVRLTDNSQSEEMSSFSPDGKQVAYIYGYDLYATDVETQTSKALTSGGTEILRNGKASWVYYEEVFGRSWRAYWWSPDSEYIAYLQFDSAPVPEFVITDDRSVKQRVENTRYPKPGDPNPVVKLGVVRVDGSGDTMWIDLSDYAGIDFLITGVGWYPEGDKVLFYVQDRTQTWLDLCVADVSDGKVTKILRDQTDAWVDPPPMPRFLADGSFILQSERSGWRHLYHFGADGSQIAVMTPGEWDVKSVVRVDEVKKLLYVMGNKDNPIGRDLYRVNFEGTGLTLLTNGKGTHSISISTEGTYFVDSWSSYKNPTQVTLNYTGDGEIVRMLDTNPVYALEEFNFCEYEQYFVENADGFKLAVSLMKPVDFDSAKKYPVWFSTYAGPSAPTIRDAWGRGNTGDQALANEGFLILGGDPQSASGRGAVSAWKAYRQLGVTELQDIETIIRSLSENPWVDKTRIGMTGHSYGGYITAYALTHSDLFAAGIAGAAVCDWQDYDSIYTERYMQTPAENPEGYKVSSVLEGAENLHGNLLLLHGAIDDNVHMQNIVRFIQALQNANKKFELMIYPNARHGIWGQHYSNIIRDFIMDNLGPESELARESSLNN